MSFRLNLLTIYRLIPAPSDNNLQRLSMLRFVCRILISMVGIRVSVVAIYRRASFLYWKTGPTGELFGWYLQPPRVLHYYKLNKMPYWGRGHGSCVFLIQARLINVASSVRLTTPWHPDSSKQPAGNWKLFTVEDYLPKYMYLYRAICCQWRLGYD